MKRFDAFFCEAMADSMSARKLDGDEGTSAVSETRIYEETGALHGLSRIFIIPSPASLCLDTREKIV